MIVFGVLARKKDGDKSRLVVERAKFAKHAMISAAVCYGGNGRLHFIRDKAKENSKLYRESLLPKLIEDCTSRLLSGFIFQQDRVPAHTAKLAQNWIPPTAVTSSGNTNGHRTHQTLTLLLTVMSEELCVNATRHFNPSQIPSTSWRKSYNQREGSATELKSTRPYVLSIVKRLRGFVKAGGVHFEHVLR